MTTERELIEQMERRKAEYAERMKAMIEEERNRINRLMWFSLFGERFHRTGTDPVASDTIDIPHEVVEDKQLPAHEPQEPKP